MADTGVNDGCFTLPFRRRDLLWSLIPVALAFLLTAPDFIGDTAWYAEDIAAYAVSPSDAQLLWEPGHLLWRPLGFVLLHLLGKFAPYPSEPVIRTAFLLVIVSVVCTTLTTIVFQAFALRLRLPVWLSVTVTGGFLSFYTILEYSRSGTAYVPGLMWVSLAFWFTLRAIDKGSDWPRGLLPGICLGLAVLFWAPYLLSSLAIAAAALLWNAGAGRASLVRRLVLTAVIAVATGIVTSAGYAFAIGQLHLSSLFAVRGWFAGAAHGWAQTRQLTRMVSGLPRSFISLGFGGVELKRYLFHDPYAPVSIGVLIRRSLWKIAAFYLCAACLIWGLLRNRESKGLLVILATAAGPVFFAAIFLLESGAPERYLPLYPMLAVAVGFVLRDLPKRKPAALATFTFLIATACVNVADLSRFAVNRSQSESVRRLVPLRNRVSHEGMIAVVSRTDAIYEFSQNALFDPVRRSQPLPIYIVANIASDRTAQWRESFAEQAIKTLDRGQAVWISSRLLASAPEPSWRWTEGDDRRIAWKDFRPFFAQFDYSGSAGDGVDGFRLVAPTPRNRMLLTNAARL